MKKRIFSTLLALCMLLCLMPTAAFAEESTETPPVCSCETACTAESMNTDCPVCGAEGALPESCAKCAQPADAAAVQPEGEVSDPQPETALTALSGEGATPAAGETVRDVRTADELTAAIADSSVNIVKLAGDISISSSLTVTRTVTLDLNGHVLQMTGNDRDPVIEVKKNSSGVGIGNLTLIDSAPNTAHKFTPNADGLWVLNEENGTKTVNGGVITGSKEIGIWVEGVHDPHLTQKPAEAYCAHLIMTGGNIVGCAAAAGGGVFAGFYAYFTMTGGSIRGCAAAAGGGVCLTNSASFAMGGNALIADCISTDGGSCGGGGIGADLYALVALSGNAVIQNCTAQHGGGVYLNDATLTMSENASVTGCNSIAGGGVSARGNATESDPPVFIMEGSSSITDCTALNGGGIFVSTSGGKVSLSGSAKIKNCRTVKRDGVDFPNVTGGGVHVSSGSFEMSGGSIESCTAVNGGDSVFVCTGGNGKFTMTGGTIRSCTATAGHGGGICSVRQLHSLPAAARPSSVRCSRRDNGLLIRRVRMPSSARLHIRTPCSRRGSSVLSVPVPRSRMPRPARSSLGICTPNSRSGRSVRARRASRRTPCGRGRSRALHRRRWCRQSPSSALYARLSRKCRAAPDAAAVLAA